MLACGAARLHFVDEEGARRALPGVDLPLHGRPSLAAVRLRVADLDQAARVLRSGGADPLRMADGSIAIGTGDAHGVPLVFTSDDARATSDEARAATAGR